MRIVVTRLPKKEGLLKYERQSRRGGVGAPPFLFLDFFGDTTGMKGTILPWILYVMFVCYHGRMEFLRRMFRLSNREVTRVVSSVNSDVIVHSYRRRIRDIDSLKKYDQGEKKIDAPDLRTVVQNV